MSYFRESLQNGAWQGVRPKKTLISITIAWFMPL